MVGNAATHAHFVPFGDITAYPGDCGVVAGEDFELSAYEVARLGRARVAESEAVGGERAE